MKKFFRYNSRHRLYFPGQWALPQLNPTYSRSHNEATGKRTWSIDEPLWLYRLRQHLFANAGAHWCPSRGVNARRDQPLPDLWSYGPDDNRTCSYCGSIHFEDLMRICKKTFSDPGYGVEGTTKSYKVYVKQPNVRNASEGAIKFYMHHLPDDFEAGDKLLLHNAVKVTSDRFEAEMAARNEQRLKVVR